MTPKHGRSATNAAADRAERKVEPMRQIISTAVVAVIVGALAGATMSAVAQAPAEQAITPAAGINAATVDGKSAVGYTDKKPAAPQGQARGHQQARLTCRSNIVQAEVGTHLEQARHPR